MTGIKQLLDFFSFFFLSSIKMLMEPEEYCGRKLYLKYIHQDHHAIWGLNLSS